MTLTATIEVPGRQQRGPDTLSVPARFAYEMCDPTNPDVNPAEVAAVVCDDTPERIWEELATLRGPGCSRVAAHPLLPEAHQWTFARSGDNTAGAALLHRPDTAGAIVDHLVDNGSHYGLTHPNVSRRRLWKHHNGDAAHYVARNPTAGVYLRIIATNAVTARTHPDGRRLARTLAKNPTTPAEVLRELIATDWGDLWWANSIIASHPNTPVEAIQEALDAVSHESGWVRHGRTQLAARLRDATAT